MNNGDGYFITQIKNCIDEFYEFYFADVYISKKMYDKFLDKYRDVFSLINKYKEDARDYYEKIIIISQRGYEMIENKNKNFVDRHLIEDKNYFDNLFGGVDSNILLDEEQRRAILIDEDYSLVIAGAGSGKTTTMAAKVKYLIEKKKVSPNNIILLAFTNKATDELNYLLNDVFKLGVEVLTFHKLGMKFIRNIISKPVQIVSEKGIYAILSDYFVNNVFQNKELLKKYLIYFKDFLHLDESCLNFDNYNDYYKNYMDIRYNQHKDNISEYIKNRINERSRYLKTINGEYVKSDGEYKIANYLYTKGINYSYEKLYPYKLINGRSYSPDFTIEESDRQIYLEYYGLAKLNIDGSYISENKNYEIEIYQKRNTHVKNKTSLIEVFGRYEDNDFYLSKLFFELKRHNIKFKERENKEIFYRLLETSKDFPYILLIRFFTTFISLFKELNYNENDFQQFIQKANDDIVKKQLELLSEVYIYYQKFLHDNYKIDFQDMINYSYSNMNIIRDKKNFINYDYVIIDEYQDISLQRYNFAKKISDLFESKIVAVGDDWQTIFSFSGSDIKLFTKFYELMGYAEIIKITKTYRNSQELIDLAGNFISKNNEQIFKELKSDKHLKFPVELIKYDYTEKFDNLPIELNKLIKKIYSANPNEKILLLTRFNDEIDNLLDSKLFYKKSKLDDKIFCRDCENAQIDILSIHKSKGLGYDQVILLNAINETRGFPSKLKDHETIKLIKGDINNLDDIMDSIEYSEERRLFYVAMTRTKNKFYIMIPNDFKYQSDFVKEIMNNENVMS